MSSKVTKGSAAEADKDPVGVVDGLDILDALPRTTLARFDAVKAGLAALDGKYAAYVPDLTNKKGEDEARANRRELVKIRTTTEKVYSEVNAPILAAQREARAIKAEIIEKASMYEAPIDAAIRAHEEEAEKRRLEKAAKEAARIKTIRDRINVISGLPLMIVEMTADQIASVIEDAKAMPLTEERFAEFLQEAVDLADQVIPRLSAVHAAAVAREAEAKRLIAERADIDRIRAEQAEADRVATAKQAQEDAERAEILRLERADLDARQAAIDAANRAADERVAASARKAEEAEAARRKRDAENEDFLRKQQDAFEAERLAALKAIDDERVAQAAERAALSEQGRAIEAASEAGKVEVAEGQVSMHPLAASLAPSPEPVRILGQMPVEMLDHCTEDPTDLDILALIAGEYNLTMEEGLARLRMIDIDALAADVADSEIPA